MIVASFTSVVAQEKCDAWDAYGNYLEEKITRIFTSEEHTDYRERAMPGELKSVSVSDISRLNLPNDQSICDDILDNMYGDEPVPGPPKYRAMWKIKDYYLLVVFSIEDDSNGIQQTVGPVVGGIYDADYDLVTIIPNL